MASLRCTRPPAPSILGEDDEEEAASDPACGGAAREERKGAGGAGRRTTVPLAFVPLRFPSSFPSFLFTLLPITLTYHDRASDPGRRHCPARAPLPARSRALLRARQVNAHPGPPCARPMPAFSCARSRSGVARTCVLTLFQIRTSSIWGRGRRRRRVRVCAPARPARARCRTGRSCAARRRRCPIPIKCTSCWVRGRRRRRAGRAKAWWGSAWTGRRGAGYGLCMRMQGRWAFSVSVAAASRRDGGGRRPRGPDFCEINYV
jgi:hypothetical protein